MGVVSAINNAVTNIVYKGTPTAAQQRLNAPINQGAGVTVSYENQAYNTPSNSGTKTSSGTVIPYSGGGSSSSTQETTTAPVEATQTGTYNVNSGVYTDSNGVKSSYAQPPTRSTLTNSNNLNLNQNYQTAYQTYYNATGDSAKASQMALNWINSQVGVSTSQSGQGYGFNSNNVNLLNTPQKTTTSQSIPATTRSVLSSQLSDNYNDIGTQLKQIANSGQYSRANIENTRVNPNTSLQGFSDFVQTPFNLIQSGVEKGLTAVGYKGVQTTYPEVNLKPNYGSVSQVMTTKGLKDIGSPGDIYRPKSTQYDLTPNDLGIAARLGAETGFLVLAPEAAATTYLGIQAAPNVQNVFNPNLSQGERVMSGINAAGIIAPIAFGAALKAFTPEVRLTETKLKIDSIPQVADVKNVDVVLGFDKEGNPLSIGEADIYAKTRLESSGRIVKVEAQSPISKFFGKDPFTYEGNPYKDPLGYQKAIKLVEKYPVKIGEKTFKFNKDTATDALRFQNVKLVEPSMSASVKDVLSNTRDETLLKGTVETPNKQIQIGNLKSRGYEPKVSMISSGTKSEGILNLNGNELSMSRSNTEMNNMFGTNEGVYNKLNQAGKTTNLYESATVSRFMDTGNIKLRTVNNLDIFSDADVDLYKQVSRTKQLNEGLFSKGKVTESTGTVRINNPKDIAVIDVSDMQEVKSPYKYEKVSKELPRNQEQIDNSIKSNFKDIKNTLEKVYGSPKETTLNIAGSDIKISRIDESLSPVKEVGNGVVQIVKEEIPQASKRLSLVDEAVNSKSNSLFKDINDIRVQRVKERIVNSIPDLSEGFPKERAVIKATEVGKPINLGDTKFADIANVGGKIGALGSTGKIGSLGNLGKIPTLGTQSTRFNSMNTETNTKPITSSNSDNSLKIVKDNKENTKVINGLGISSGSSSGSDVLSGIKPSDNLKDNSNNGIKPGERLDQPPAQQQPQQPKQDNGIAQIISQVYKQPNQTIPFPVFPNTPRPKNPNPIKPKIRIQINDDLSTKSNQRARIRNKARDVFTVEIRRHGKFQDFAKVGSLGKAVELGKMESRRTLAASFRVKENNRLLSLNPSQEFVKSKSYKDPFSLIQFRGSRLNSNTERLEIKQSRGRKMFSLQ